MVKKTPRRYTVTVRGDQSTRITLEERPMYTIDLDLATVEALEQGLCPEKLAQLAHDLLRWRREALRATTSPRSYPEQKGSPSCAGSTPTASASTSITSTTVSKRRKTGKKSR
jgi:hypothetical protein